MTWTTTTHRTSIMRPDGDTVELEIQLELAPAEPDVGISGPFIDNWSIIAVGGVTDAEVCLEAEQWILDDDGSEEAFVERMYEEGAADE